MGRAGSAGSDERCVVGVDLGTLSGRVVVVRVADGAVLGSAVHEYAHGVVEGEWRGRRLAPGWALQVPEDYLEVLRTAVPAALRVAGVRPEAVVGIGCDATSCTVLPTDATGTPLCALPEYADRPHAYAKLWKHHAAQGRADRITALAEARGETWLAAYGGRISAEGQYAKALELFEEDRPLYDTMRHWVEVSDWVVWQLGGAYVRNASAAGYKGIGPEGVSPSAEFLEALAPGFASFVPDKLAHPVAQLGTRAGRLTAQAAAWTGLPEGIAVATGNVDAHVTAAGVGAVEPGRLALITGTSTCHITSADVRREIPGVCGVVEGGVVAGRFGYEAGQSGSGDILAWFARTGVPAAYVEAAAAAGESVHEHLTRLAGGLEVGATGLVALDWHSGNRSVLMDHELSGLVVGLTLATRPEEVYRALLEATAFGTRVVVEALEGGGVPVREVFVAGGLTGNPLLLQILADVLRRPLSVVRVEHAGALGSAVHAAVAAGAYADVPTAARSMAADRVDVLVPDEARAQAYDALFAVYTELYDGFGRESDVMRRLAAVRRAALRSPTPG
ncbi:ribulokinase [Nocardioides anomalus]|uniref:ribulokinase n=1 Tax=Nocardioides anomalus TaxID=2712223 RepID=UPI0018AD37A5|nr:ribulokinase [Nocardioides anomalus]